MREADRGAQVTMIAGEAVEEQAAIIWRAAEGVAATVQTVRVTVILRRRALCHVAPCDGREFGEDPVFPGSKPFQPASGFARWWRQAALFFAMGGRSARAPVFPGSRPC